MGDEQPPSVAHEVHTKEILTSNVDRIFKDIEIAVSSLSDSIHDIATSYLIS